MFLSDLLWDAFNREAAQHQVATAIATEALLLAAAYLVIDRIVAKQEATRFAGVATFALQHLYIDAAGVEKELKILLKGGKARLAASVRRLEERLIQDAPVMIAHPETVGLTQAGPTLIGLAKQFPRLGLLDEDDRGPLQGVLVEFSSEVDRLEEALLKLGPRVGSDHLREIRLRHEFNETLQYAVRTKQEQDTASEEGTDDSQS